MAIKFAPQSPAEQAKEIIATTDPEVVEALRIELAPPPKPKRTRAPNGTFDRNAYQRELMRKRRAAEKAKPP